MSSPEVQTDNGSQFVKHFDDSSVDNHLTTSSTILSNSKSNAHCERFNRTVHELCLNLYPDHLDEAEQIHYYP